MPNRVPGLPGDPENDRGNQERDYGVAYFQPECYKTRAEHDAEADERIYAGMVAVGYESGAVKPVSGPRSDPSRKEVAPKAHQTGQGKRVQVVGWLRMDKTLAGFVGSYTGRNEDCSDDRKTGISLRPRGAE